MFHVGQRVVLVGWIPEHVPAWKGIGAVYPKVGEVYTIRAINPWRDTAVILLEEIDNSHLPYNLEPGIEQRHFRPVRTTSKLVEAKTPALT